MKASFQTCSIVTSPRENFPCSETNFLTTSLCSGMRVERTSLRFYDIHDKKFRQNIPINTV